VRILERIKEAQKLREEKHYQSSIDEYGKILQAMFEELYKECFPWLSEADAEKILSYRKESKKQIDKFTIGEWIGLFRAAKLFDAIEKTKKRPDEKSFVFFTSDVVAAINELRNRSTHSDNDLRQYSPQQIASFVESAVICMLQELKMISETDTMHQAVFPKRVSNLANRFSQISREDILKASLDPEINDFRFVNKYIEIEGRKYSVKGLLSLASGTSPSSFTTDSATRILSRLGFKVMEVQVPTQTSPEEGASIIETSSMPYDTKEEGLLHMTITKVYSTVDKLLEETKKHYSTVEGVETLTPAIASKIIKNSWNGNHRILAPFKNDAFRFYLEKLLNEKLE